MSRCKQCKYDECDAPGVCYDTCPMYANYGEHSYCKCVAHDFDNNENCPYFVDRGTDDEV